MATQQTALRAVHEWCAHDPFGKIKGTDVDDAYTLPVTSNGTVVLTCARGGYASCRILVNGTGSFSLEASFEGEVEADLFRAWYHRLPKTKKDEEVWLPDALPPYESGADFSIPDPENKIEGQTVQEFWLDIYVPADAPSGAVKGTVQLKGDEEGKLAIEVHASEAVLPDEPSVQMDHNCYGARSMFKHYPSQFEGVDDPRERWERVIGCLHNIYRLVHEHRSLFHNLGYGHSGRLDPIFRPNVTGRGRTRDLADWELYDKHYGPLLDGSAFREAAPGQPRPRRKDNPIWGVYTPLNPDWPARYVNWGEKGYEVEFVRGVKAFDAHLQEKGWTKSHIEFFFNHKKRYRWFEWDGDETKYGKDIPYHHEMCRMFKEATSNTPVQWIYRADASWQLKNMFEALNGQRNFWVCAGLVRWYREELEAVQARGDVTWFYGGYSSLRLASSAILRNLWQTWARGLNGFTAWQTNDPGKDPWFECNGSSEAAFYPGERFGLPGPIPSIRLKILRNGIQDIDLLDRSTREQGNQAETRAAMIKSIPLTVWERPPLAVRTLPPDDWDSKNMEAEHEPGIDTSREPDPTWWRQVRAQAECKEGR